MIQINDNFAIPERALSYTFSASPGPGGQNVNKVATKATLWLDLSLCEGLSEQQKFRISSALRNRIGADGRLRVASHAHRTQVANRTAAIEKLVALLRGALRPVKVRRKTNPTQGSKTRRVEAKRRRTAVKSMRRYRAGSD